MSERKELLSVLVKQIALTPVDLPDRQTKIDILWHSGAVTSLSTLRPRHNSTHRLPDEIVAVIRKLALDRDDKKIAADLNDLGFAKSRERPFAGGTVSGIRERYGIKKPQADPAVAASGSLDGGRYMSTSALARRLGMSIPCISYWRKIGLLSGFQKGRQGPWWYEISNDTLAKLMKRAARSAGRRKSLSPPTEAPVQ